MWIEAGDQRGWPARGDLGGSVALQKGKTAEGDPAVSHD
jgi:hypothetical protein